MKEKTEHLKHQEDSKNPINRKLRLFSSFTEMNEADAKEMAALSPIEYLQNSNFLIEKYMPKN